MFGVIVEFPRMKVGVVTREARATEIRYLLEAKRWLLLHEYGADAFELRP